MLHVDFQFTLDFLHGWKHASGSVQYLQVFISSNFVLFKESLGQGCNKLIGHCFFLFHQRLHLATNFVRTGDIISYHQHASWIAVTTQSTDVVFVEHFSALWFFISSQVQSNHFNTDPCCLLFSVQFRKILVSALPLFLISFTNKKFYYDGQFVFSPRGTSPGRSLTQYFVE